ncbi:MAG: hypothetical protein IJI73_05405, partial [Kiritimatiellae bacterium]|nr:hypothetical protein [Kiritimatiellia bacterium]
AAAGERRVTAAVSAPGARFAAVTLVDEGVNLLTSEPVPDPIAFHAMARTGDHPLHDVFERILPVAGEKAVKASGVKTGGGADADMLSRISPVASRRFKPLALWKAEVPLDAEGRATVDFELPEFAGEVRVTAVAWSDVATGSGAVQCKITPKLVIRPDAPRFVAPGDEFEVSLPVANMSGAEGEAAYEISAVDATGGTCMVCKGSVRLADGETSVVRVPVKASGTPGEMVVRYAARGFGETRSDEIALPVRPAVPWRKTAGVEALGPGAAFDLGATSVVRRVRWSVSGTRMSELAGALEWLADYPHGCLEQTSSRIFPLIAADGILSAFSPSVASNRAEYVAAGVRRVASMVRERDFTMWPDCSYAPWDREVSLYAAHFLVEAKRSGAAVPPRAEANVMRFLEKWAMSTNAAVSAYACHTLALAGRPEKDRMLRLYDSRGSLDLLSRARLSRAFAAVGDRRRAAVLFANAASPETVKEAAFLVLAMLDCDPDDGRVPALVSFLCDRRDKSRFCWGTTSENAHALLAVGDYFRRPPPAKGEPKAVEAGGSVVNIGQGPAFVAWERLELPDAADVKDESGQLSVRRRFLKPDGSAADISSISRGDLVVVELELASTVSRDYADLVIEDLFAGALEPVRAALDPSLFPWAKDVGPDWVLRSDARDDRMLVFSKKFHLERNEKAVFRYQLRAVTAGSFALPQVAVEGMYHPELRARAGAGRVVVRH